MFSTMPHLEELGHNYLRFADDDLPRMDTLNEQYFPEEYGDLFYFH